MKRKRNRTRKFRLWLILVQLSLLTVILTVLYVSWQVNRPINISSETVIQLNPGDNVYDLARMLQKHGDFDQPFVLIWTARIGGFERNLQAGEYQLKPEFSLLDTLNYIAEGYFVTYSIRFLEGWTFEEFLSQFSSADKIEHTLAGVAYEDILNELNIPIQNPEGWFFPDTYFYNAGQSDASILQTSYQAMQSALEKEWALRKPDLPYETPYEGLIVASIIQKESNVFEEYPIIAGVIVNRLRKGMRLQMDSTVIYGLGGIDGRITRTHLNTDTEHNTYTRAGLPPTPIAMPGLAALRAAAQPADTTSFYFVARGDGSHTFSDTLAEHNKAVSEYRKLLNN